MRYKELIVRRVETAKNSAVLVGRGVENQNLTAQETVDRINRIIVDLEAAQELIEKED